MDATNFPKLRIVYEETTNAKGEQETEGCEAFVFALENFTLVDNEGKPLGPTTIQHAALKEPLDLLRHHFHANRVHITPEMTRVVGGLSR